jgi:glutathione S-transferase
VLWLLEEIGAPYEIVAHQREASGQAPPAMRKLHGMGKSPIIVDDGVVIAESGAILDYLSRRHGGGRLSVSEDSPHFADYLYWLHFAEGSGMPPAIAKMYLAVAGETAPVMTGLMDSLIKRRDRLIEASLEGRDYLAGDDLTAADINMEMVLGAAARDDAGKYPNISRVVAQWRLRPAYLRAHALG